MDINSLKWNENICNEFGVPQNSLPQIHSCSELFGNLSSDYKSISGLPITGYHYIQRNRVIGDQQSACLGHLLKTGEAKCTYGTGCFVLSNTGTKPVISSNMLLTTLCYQLGPNAKPYYALEVKYKFIIGIYRNGRG